MTEEEMIHVVDSWIEEEQDNCAFPWTMDQIENCGVSAGEIEEALGLDFED